VFDAIDDMEVDGHMIPSYDTYVTGPNQPDFYTLLSTQASAVDKDNKCEWFWDTSILLDVVTRYPRPGNPGSRLLADDIMESVRNLTNDLTLTGGLATVSQRQSFPNDITTVTSDEIVYRKLMRLELKIK